MKTTEKTSKRPQIVRVTKTEFELEDGTIYPHAIELDEVPTPEEFQETYDHWLQIFKEQKLIKEKNE